jgi:anti-sigma B factor antagonist
MARFGASMHVDSGRTVVRVTGDCDLAAREEMTLVLTAAVAQSPTVVVDLARVDFLDSSGINALLAGHRTARQYGRDLYVVNAQDTIAKVMEVTGIAGMLTPPRDGDPE